MTVSNFLATYLRHRPNATDQQLADYLFWHHFDLVKSHDQARELVRQHRALYSPRV